MAIYTRIDLKLIHFLKLIRTYIVLELSNYNCCSPITRVKDVLMLGVHNPADRLHRPDLLRPAHRHHYRRRIRENLRVGRLYLFLSLSLSLSAFLLSPPRPSLQSSLFQPLSLSLSVSSFLCRPLSFTLAFKISWIIFTLCISKVRFAQDVRFM